MYHQDSDVSTARKLIIFCGCMCLSSEYSSLEGGETAEYYDRLSRSFQQASLRAIGELPLVVSPTWENMEGLLAAVRLTNAPERWFVPLM